MTPHESQVPDPTFVDRTPSDTPTIASFGPPPTLATPGLPRADLTPTQATPGALLYLCMESPRVWQEAFGFTPDGQTLSRLLNGRVLPPP